jgi:hypothetical protein
MAFEKFLEPSLQTEILLNIILTLPAMLLWQRIQKLWMPMVQTHLE